MHLGCFPCVMMRRSEYDEMTVGDASDCSGNVMYGPGYDEDLDEY